MHKVPHVQLYNSMFTISFTLVQVPCLKLYNLQKQFHVYRYNPQLHFTCNCRVQRYSPQVWLYNLQVQFHKCNSTAYMYNSTVYMYSSMCATLQPTCATLQLQFHENNPTAYVYNSTVYMYSSTCETLQSTCTTNKYISTCTVYKYTSTCKVYKCISIKRQLKKKKKMGFGRPPQHYFKNFYGSPDQWQYIRDSGMKQEYAKLIRTISVAPRWDRKIKICVQIVKNVNKG